MKPLLAFKLAARLEYAEAVAWYENARPGLGREFAEEVALALQHARSQPELFPQVRGRARKIRLKRFKAYSIYFAIKDDSLIVIAIFHGSRNPAELYRRLT